VTLVQYFIGAMKLSRMNIIHLRAFVSGGSCSVPSALA
jgi:hypothetical protein